MPTLAGLGLSNAHVATDPFLTHLATGHTMSYADLARTTAAASRALRRRGVVAGDRVVLFAQNHWSVFPLLLACGMRRAALVPLDPSLHETELGHIVAHSAPRIVVRAGDRPRTAGAPGVDMISLEELMEAPAEDDSGGTLDEGSRDDVALIIYTSGTTGSAKGVMLTQGNLVSMAASFSSYYAIKPSDTFYCVLPTYHMNALMMTGLLPMISGAHVVLSDLLSFRNAKFYWERVAKHGVTIVSLVPSLLALLLKLSESNPVQTPRTVRHAFVGAAPLPAALWRSFEARFGIPVYQGYGLTETTTWATATPPSDPRRYDTTGVPLDVAEIRIDTSVNVAPDDIVGDRRSRSSPPDATMERRISSRTVGEILIGGSIVMAGYFREPSLTKQVLSADGLLRTGDLGFVDDDGFVHVIGRIKDMIIKNGRNIASKEVDDVLLRHEAVQESKTIGLPDAMVGERVHSACVLEPNAKVTTDELLSWMRSQLSNYKVPDRITFVGQIPRGQTGKPNIGLLRKILSGALADSTLDAWKASYARPSDPKRTLEIIQRGLTSATPVPLLVYWTARDRRDVETADRDAVARLLRLVEGAPLPASSPALLRFLFADVRAHLEGMSHHSEYFRALESYVRPLGIETIFISDLWREDGLDPLDVQKRVDPARGARLDHLIGTTESDLLERRFADHLLLTGHPPEFDFLPPALPTLVVEQSPGS